MRGCTCWTGRCPNMPSAPPGAGNRYKHVLHAAFLPVIISQCIHIICSGGGLRLCARAPSTRGQGHAGNILICLSAWSPLSLQVAAYVRTRTLDEVLLMVKDKQGASGARLRAQEDWKGAQKNPAQVRHCLLRQDAACSESCRNVRLGLCHLYSQQSKATADSRATAFSDFDAKPQHVPRLRVTSMQRRLQGNISRGSCRRATQVKAAADSRATAFTDVDVKLQGAAAALLTTAGSAASDGSSAASAASEASASGKPPAADGAAKAKKVGSQLCNFGFFCACTGLSRSSVASRAWLLSSNVHNPIRWNLVSAPSSVF